MIVRSKVFTITRASLARAASEQYLRRMWPIFVAFPVFGLAAMALGPNPYLRAVGFLAFIWPFSIPARVVIASWGKSKRLMQPTWVSVDGEAIIFHDEMGGGTILPFDQMRRADKRGPYYVFETIRFNFALVPIDAFDENSAKRFEQVVLSR